MEHSADMLSALEVANSSIKGPTFYTHTLSHPHAHASTCKHTHTHSNIHHPVVSARKHTAKAFTFSEMVQLYIGVTKEVPKGDKVQLSSQMRSFEK